MKRVRLCHFITDSLIIGGAEMFLLDLLRNLPADAYEHQVIILRGEGELLHRVRALGIPVRSARLGRKVDLAGLWRAARLVRKFRPDVLHTHLFHASLLGAVLGKLLRIPVVLSTEHTGELVGARARLARWRARMTHRFVAVSHAVGDLLTQAGISAAKVEVIQNGIELAKFEHVAAREEVRAEFNIPADATLLGMVAGFRPAKGHEYLVPAFAMIQERFPNALLMLVGDGPQRPGIEELARSLGVYDRIRFTGFRRDIPALLSAMDLFVLSSYGEGLPICVLEAMAMGLPAVVTNDGGVPEVVADGETGLLVPKQNPAALADALTEALRDPARLRRMGRAGRQRVEAQFDMRVTAAAYHALYQQLLGGGRT